MREPLGIMRSFRFRILALVLGIVTIVASATVIAVIVTAHAQVERQAGLRLQSAAQTAREVLKFRGNQLTSAVEVLTSDFGFKEAVALGDTPTLQSVIANQRSRIAADILIVLDSKGKPLASTLVPLSVSSRSELHDLIDSDSDGELLRLYRLIDGQPYQLVLAPILAPDPIGWTAMGFALDDKLALDMSRLLGVQISFIADVNAARPYVASSLKDAEHLDPTDIAGRASGVPFSVKTNANEFLTWTDPIRSANGSLTLVLQESLASARHPYEQLTHSVLMIAVAIFAVAALLAALLARSATRPVEDLTRAAERLESGDYSTPVPSASTSEIARLSSAFNAMRAAVAERERIIRHQALHDPLTGLPTRTRMTELLDALLLLKRQQRHSVAACLIKVLQFQNVVGSFGHAAADEMLREVAKRLSASAGTHNRVARIGTDQFLVVLDTGELPCAIASGNLIAERLKAPFDYDSVSLPMEISIGVSTFPTDGACAADLLQRAELALYRAAETGALISGFVPGDDAIHRHRLAILGDLRRAIGADELELHYQPKVSLISSEVIGCEALVRWRHPQKGLIPPGDFVTHAERSGLIRVLTGWVLGAAFRQLNRWLELGISLDMAINVSPSDLADPAFATSVIALLKETGVDASRIVLEVTESGAMRDLPNTLRIMQELRVLGIRFSIDDFGTGYSSLAHLRRLPVDEIKIDRSFVQELEKPTADDVILRSTINLGHALNLKVVAEGVELAASRDALRIFGCDSIQGYFVSKPLPAGAFAAWLESRRRDSSSVAEVRSDAPTRAQVRDLRAYRG